jgi:uncharacterized protein (TIGR03118 family)
MAGCLVAQNTLPNNFLVHNLVSDLPGLADKQDKNLVNPWGNAFGQSPFWIGNNGSGTSTLYDGYGTPVALVVSIPTAAGANTGGTVTGVMRNAFGSNTAVLDVAPGKPASFLWCSEDGIITGWNSTVDATHAKVLLDNSKSGAVYKGCALGGTSAAPLIFAANFNSGKVDEFDGNFNPVVNAVGVVVNANAFVDPLVPAGFAPFNVQILNGNVYVAYALQNAAKHEDVAGVGNGYVAVFDMSGNLLSTLISKGPLNSPWGFAIAPATFAPFGGALLVGNFRDGLINAFDPTTGKLLGTLNDTKGKPIAIPGLWSINFGSGAQREDVGTLYFTAGIGGGPNNDPIEKHGLLGSIQAAPAFVASGVQNDGSLLAGPIAPNTWVALAGAGMSATAGTWQVTSSTLPIQTNGVGVTVNGEAAPVSSVGNTLLVFLVPADIVPGGTAKIQTTNNGLTSAAVTVPVAGLSPAFLPLGTAAGITYIAATHADGSFIGPTTLIAGKTTPAKAGETIVLYAVGFGQTSPPIPNGQAIPSPLPLPVPPTILIDAIPAKVTFSALVAPGLYQFNVIMPEGVRSGDALVVGLLGIGETQLGAFISVQ